MGQNLLAIRLKKGWSRSKLEKATGISNIYQKEHGIRKINESDLCKLSEVLNCAKSDIIGDSTIYLDIATDTVLVSRYYLETIQLNEQQELVNIVDKVPFSVRWLRDTLKICDETQIIILRCDNNFLFPLIEKDDTIFIDLQDKTFTDGSIYLFQDVDQKLKIKRANQLDADIDKISLSYSNSQLNNNSTQLVNKTSFLDKICGRVVYCGKRMIAQ